MDSFQAEAPVLVDMDLTATETAAPDPAITQMEEMNLIKVPMTIVTGTLCRTIRALNTAINDAEQAILVQERRHS